MSNRITIIRSGIICVALLLALSPLRLVHLGYSEFQDDEKKAFFRLRPNENVLEFIVRQRKGPSQFVLSYIPYFFTKDYRNEFAERIPFAIINIGSIAVLYLLLKKLTQSEIASTFGAILYGTNGFIVGFSRIVQYQSLNLFFSFTALYFYVKLTQNHKNLIRSSILGTFFYSLSLLSHWDAIFYTVPLVYFWLLFLFRKDIERKTKLKILAYNAIIFCFLCLPFLFANSYYHFTHPESLNYLERRIGISDYSWSRHGLIFGLYNPFFTFQLFITFLCISLFFLKKNWVYMLWFIVNLIAIKYLMSKPGTHVYNYIIPLIFVYSISIGAITANVSWFTKFMLTMLTLTIGALFYYQSLMLFVDHNPEYPWEAKTIFGRRTQAYFDKEVLTFGFPHYRGWKQINNFVLKYNNTCGYLTNEGKEISQIYIDLNYGQADKCYYAISVKKPFISTRDKVVFPTRTNKIYEVKVDGKLLVEVYGRKF